MFLWSTTGDRFRKMIGFIGPFDTARAYTLQCTVTHTHTHTHTQSTVHKHTFLAVVW
jgi:hypothetical protein